MRYAVNSKEAKQIDDYTINAINIPQAVLMERAAYEVTVVMKRQIKKEERILAVCGLGNNGGDGVAAGRILYLQGYRVAILFLGEKEKASAGMKAQLEIAEKIGIPFENSNKLSEYNIIIDAIFGVGLSRPVMGIYQEIINQINGMDCTVFSVDIPSGISADDGSIMNCAIHADATVTFGQRKKGILLYPGAEYAGAVTVADIGFPPVAVQSAGPDTIYYEPEDLEKLPARLNYSNKGTYGKVLIIAGSNGMSGAACLSARAAYRMGAGLVKVLTSSENRIILQTSIPEALYGSYQEEDLEAAISWASVIVIGPGLGLSQNTQLLLDTVFQYAKVPVIIDADGITMLSRMIDQQISLNTLLAERTDSFRSMDLPGHTMNKGSVSQRVEYAASFYKGQIIVTPHLAELSRLINTPVSGIANNLIDTACQCSYNNDLIYAIKDARTVVAYKKYRFINTSGNNGMATGGSGDVLTGIIAALIAQRMKPYEATCLAVYLHGLAGDIAAQDKGRYSMMAGDIVDAISKVLRKASELS